jgi:hypothetical protein
MTPRDKHFDARALKVGDAVWVYDENRRVYKRDEHGNTTGGPVWREHWVKHVVVGENRATFFLATSNRYPFDEKRVGHYRRIRKADLKVGAPLRDVAFDEKDLDRRAWIQDNADALSVCVQRSLDFEKLAQVARMLAPDRAPPEDLT